MRRMLALGMLMALFIGTASAALFESGTNDAQPVVLYGKYNNTIVPVKVASDGSVGGGGGMATYTVCASDKTAAYKCDYTATGTADQDTINSALTATGALTNGGVVKLTEGNFSTNAPVLIPSNVTLDARGANITLASSSNCPMVTNTNYKTYVFTVTAANATAGATYTNNTQTFTVVTTIAGTTTLTTTGTALPAASGTLTKSAGSGDATITFSAFSGNTNTNITIIGGKWNGNAAGQGAFLPNSTSANKYAGYHGIFLKGVTTFNIHDVFINDAANFSIFLANSASGRLNNSRVYTSGAHTNGDGVSIYDSNNISVSNIDAQTEDDSIVILACRAPVYNVNYRGVVASGSHGRINIVSQSLTDCTSSGDIYDINFSDMALQPSTEELIRIDNESATTADIRRLNFNNITGAPGQAADSIIWLAGTRGIVDVNFNNFNVTGGANIFNTTGQAFVRVNFSNWIAQNMTSGFVFSNNTTNSITMNNIQVNCNTTSSSFGISMPTATNPGIQVSNAVITGCGTGISIESRGSVTNSHLVSNTLGITHTDATNVLSVSGITYASNTTNYTLTGAMSFSVGGNMTVNFPAAQTIAAGNTVAADACGSVKFVSSAGAVATDTTNTFTAPAIGNKGCIMDVCNSGANNITLDNNANFVSAGAADVVLTANDCVRVGSSGASGAWYQLTPLVAN